MVMFANFTRLLYQQQMLELPLLMEDVMPEKQQVILPICVLNGKMLMMPTQIIIQSMDYIQEPLIAVGLLMKALLKLRGKEQLTKHDLMQKKPKLLLKSILSRLIVQLEQDMLISNQSMMLL